MTQAAHQAYELIKTRCPDFKASIGIVLGSGLGALAEKIDGARFIAYDDLPGFPPSSVKGHKGNLVVGRIHGVNVACLQGRTHYYEGCDMSQIKTMIRTLKLLGCDTFLSTNASGSLREHVPPGSLVVINDHINMQFNNPLVGPNDDDFGPRFVAMDNVYDQDLRAHMHAAAKDLNIQLHEGVYIGVLGPTFETHAEVRALKILGGEVVGMSTIPGVICARHCGMKVMVVAAITNFGAGMQAHALSHEETVSNANKATEKMTSLVMHYIKRSAQ